MGRGVGRSVAPQRYHDVIELADQLSLALAAGLLPDTAQMRIDGIQTKLVRMRIAGGRYTALHCPREARFRPGQAEHFAQQCAFRKMHPAKLFLTLAVAAFTSQIAAPASAQFTDGVVEGVYEVTDPNAPLSLLQRQALAEIREKDRTQYTVFARLGGGGGGGY
ncbi:hypothetical protein BMS3Bbin10_01557 [bacterium BMS3Bbin10]|nr:hypothetical protein BMS3Bbin10_01557 [bacterium BMS3Bbin10]